MNHPQESAENAGWISVGCNGIEGSSTDIGTGKDPSRAQLFLHSLGSARVFSLGSVHFSKHSDDEAESELCPELFIMHVLILLLLHCVSRETM